MIRFPGLAVIVIFGPALLRAQVSLPADSAAGPALVPDSSSIIEGIPPRMISTAKIDTLPSGYSPKKSPALAMGLSALVPGAGQVYNESYWKIPIILGFEAYFASEWLNNNRNYHDFQRRYTAALLANDPNASYYKDTRDQYHQFRDTYTWYFFILYVINIADAYVDASLYDFNVGPDLSLRVLPPAMGPRGPSVGIRLGF